MSNPLWDWLGDALQNILMGISAIKNALNPMSYVVQILDVIITLFPEPADFSEFYDSYETTMNWLGPSFQLANHFINLPVFGAALLIIITVEGVLGLLRGWRAVRSLIT